MTTCNSGKDHPLYGKGGLFLVTHLASGETFEVEGLYHWAKQKGLNATALIEIADMKPIMKPSGNVSYRRQHKGYSCKRIIIGTSERCDSQHQ